MSKKQHPVVLSICGIFLIFIGVLAFIFPVFAADQIATVLGIMFIIAAVSNIVSAFIVRGTSDVRVGWSIAAAILNVILAVLMLASPNSVIAAGLGYLLVISIMLSCLMGIFFAISARQLLSGWIIILLVSILGLIFSIIVMFGDAGTMQQLIGLYAGIFLIQEGIVDLVAAGGSNTVE